MSDITLNGRTYSNVQEVKYNNKNVNVFNVNGVEVWRKSIEVSNVLSDNSWNTISQVSRAGEAQNYWQIGDTKTFSFNGVAKIAVIIGFDIDSENSITFWSQDSLGSFVMHSNNDEYGWENTSLRSSLFNGEIYNGLEDSLKSTIRTVKKRSYYNSKINVTEDKLFLLSLNESIGTTKNVLKQEGTQYDYFNSLTSWPDSNWWTRTCNGNQNNYYYIMLGANTSSTRSGTNDMRVRPGFCI